jgi:hypothetical protein
MNPGQRFRLRNMHGLRAGSLYDIGISRRRLFEFSRSHPVAANFIPLDRTRLTVKFQRHAIEWDQMVYFFIDRLGNLFVIPRAILRFIFYREGT